jgi:hypothetical protein
MTRNYLMTNFKNGQDYYNYHRPHGGLQGQTPYERLKEKTNLTTTTNPDTIVKDERQKQIFSIQNHKTKRRNGFPTIHWNWNFV